jgi:hypothetical protein
MKRNVQSVSLFHAPLHGTRHIHRSSLLEPICEYTRETLGTLNGCPVVVLQLRWLVQPSNIRSFSLAPVQSYVMQYLHRLGYDEFLALDEPTGVVLPPDWQANAAISHPC